MINKQHNPDLRNQTSDKVVDISDWSPDRDFQVFPEGSKEKYAYISPPIQNYQFILPEHRYLFKLSIERHQNQYWSEVIAYQIGQVMQVPVPPTFAAINSKTGEYGALIEWFYGHEIVRFERYYSGGYYLERLVPSYDRKKGRDHNFLDVARFHAALKKAAYLKHDWKEHWARIILFDAIIGNTDRHQDNWGVIWEIRTRRNLLSMLFRRPRYFEFSARLTPAFDNGTSLGYEILEENLHKFKDVNVLNRYVERGRHHMKWDKSDEKGIPHFTMIAEFIRRYPVVITTMEDCLRFDFRRIERSIEAYSLFDMPVPLTSNRANFMVDLIHIRVEKAAKELKTESI